MARNALFHRAQRATAVNNPSAPPPAAMNNSRYAAASASASRRSTSSPRKCAPVRHKRRANRNSRAAAVREGDPRRCAIPPIASLVAASASRSVAEVMSAPCAGDNTSAASGMVGSIQCRSQADIDIAAVFARDLEPIDEFVVDFAGFEQLEHRNPGGQDQSSRAVRCRAPRPRCARGDGGLERSRASSSSCSRKGLARRRKGSARRGAMLGARRAASIGSSSSARFRLRRE